MFIIYAVRRGHLVPIGELHCPTPVQAPDKDDDKKDTEKELPGENDKG